jgi:hypothetical protein
MENKRVCDINEHEEIRVTSWEQINIFTRIVEDNEGGRGNKSKLKKWR